MKKNVALISPNKDAYSETFIQNHKLNFDANVKYYYGGFLPEYLEGIGYLKNSLFDKINMRFNRLLNRNISYNYLREKVLSDSFKKNKIDLVFAEYGPTGVAIMDICKKNDIPLIVNFHGYDASMYDVIDAYKLKYKELFDCAYRVIGVSHEMISRLKQLGCPDDKLIYIPYGPDDRFLNIDPSYSEKAFLSVGRFVDKKAPYYTILAFKKIVEHYSNAILYMAGDGVLYDTCFNLTKYLKLENNVVFLGKCSQEELLSYYSKVKAFVQHSITPLSGDMEGTPVAILEASASALPVISTRHAGIKDVIIEGQTGFLVDEHDVDGMVEKMMFLLDNDNLVEKIGSNGRENIKQNYTVDIQMRKINELINNKSSYNV